MWQKSSVLAKAPRSGAVSLLNCPGADRQLLRSCACAFDSKTGFILIDIWSSEDQSLVCAW